MNLRILKKLSKRADQYLQVIPHYGCHCESTRLVRPSYMRGHPPIVTHIWPNTPCIAIEYPHGIEIWSAYHFLVSDVLGGMGVSGKSSCPSDVFRAAEMLVKLEQVRQKIDQDSLALEEESLRGYLS